MDVTKEPLRNLKHSSAPFRTPPGNVPEVASISDTSSLPLPPSLSQTANSMLWAIYNLSRNPAAQTRLLQEIRKTVPHGQDPNGEHIKSMPYLKACLKESMRYSTTVKLHQTWLIKVMRGKRSTFLKLDFTGKNKMYLFNSEQ